MCDQVYIALVCFVLFGAWLLGRSNCYCIWLVAKFQTLLCIEIVSCKVRARMESFLTVSSLKGV